MYRSQETVKNNTNPPAAADASDDFYWDGAKGCKNSATCGILSPARAQNVASDQSMDAIHRQLTIMIIFQITYWNAFLL